MKNSASFKLLSFVTPFMLVNAAFADDPAIQRILVEGSRTSQTGIADTASQGVVSARELEQRTVYRPGEILEAVPGLIVSQHSGEGKANQFFLRGLNLDHGTDLASYVNDMPVNQRSHAHGQGWTDLNFLIPELVGRLEYSKGPYSARSGDFSSAGTASISYINRLPDNRLVLSGGQNGYRRALLAASSVLGDGNVLYALESMRNDGPFTRGDNYRKYNVVLRYSEGYAANGWNMTAMVYGANWKATDQIPKRAVDQGMLGRFDAINASDGGAANRQSLSGSWRQTSSGSVSKFNAYLIRGKLDLFSDFTYFMRDPLNGDQFAQPDQRVTSGFAASHTWHSHNSIGLESDWTLGVTGQNDNIGNGLYQSKARQQTAIIRRDRIVETSAAAYVENATRWTDTFRTVAGLRADRYRFDVRSDSAANSGRVMTGIASPSCNLIFGPWAQTELYVNAGHGFHSNDARGTVAKIDPVNGDSLKPVPGLVRSKGVEIGLRTEMFSQMQTTVSLYRLDFDSELVYAGDAGTTEPGRPSRRYGIEFSNYLKLNKWLSIDLDAAYARARARDHDPLAGDYVEGAVEGVGQLALSVDQLGPWSGALRLRYFGPRPLTTDNRIRSHSGVTLNGRLAYQLHPAARIELEGFNLTNRAVSAIDYYYASQLPGEPRPVYDVHFHPQESRSFRISLIASW